MCLLHPSQQSLGRKMQGEAGPLSVVSEHTQEAAFCTELEIHVPHSHANEGPSHPGHLYQSLSFCWDSTLFSHGSQDRDSPSSQSSTISSERPGPHTGGCGQKHNSHWAKQDLLIVSAGLCGKGKILPGTKGVCMCQGQRDAQKQKGMGLWNAKSSSGTVGSSIRRCQ